MAQLAAGGGSQEEKKMFDEFITNRQVKRPVPAPASLMSLTEEELDDSIEGEAAEVIEKYRDVIEETMENTEATIEDSAEQTIYESLEDTKHEQPEEDTHSTMVENLDESMDDFVDKTWEKYKDKIDKPMENTMEDTSIDEVIEDPTDKTADESKQETAVDDNEEDSTAEPSLPPGWQRWNHGLISLAGVKFHDKSRAIRHLAGAGDWPTVRRLRRLLRRQAPRRLAWQVHLCRPGRHDVREQGQGRGLLRHHRRLGGRTEEV